MRVVKTPSFARRYFSASDLSGWDDLIAFDDAHDAPPTRVIADAVAVGAESIEDAKADKRKVNEKRRR